jgi:glutamate dehydrogenase
MSWETLKESLLTELSTRIDARAESGEREFLHNLSEAFFRRLPAEDMRERTVENLYGCLYGFLKFMHKWDANEPRVRIFNPEIQSHGWESHYTSIVVLCRGIPFTTASLRGELNRRNLRIHTIISSDLEVTRNAEGVLKSVQASQGVTPGEPREAILFFEIGRQTRLQELEELGNTLSDILGEVALVVDDYLPMCERLEEAAAAIRASECVPADLREEAAEFMEWLRRNHMTLLGYEYLRVEHQGSTERISVDTAASLGQLRNRDSRGVQDLHADFDRMSLDQLQQKQLSFSKSRLRSRVHRLAYPDYVEVRVFDEAGEVIGQHRFIGMYTATVYTMPPIHIPIVRRKVARVMEISNLDEASHQSRELVRVLQGFPRDELFQSSIQQLHDTATAINQIQERRQTRLFVRGDVHGKFVSCMVYIPRDRYNTEQREKIESILTQAFKAQESEFNTDFSESILVRCHFVLRVDPAVPLQYDTSDIEGQIVQATLAWEDRLRLRLTEEFGEELGEQYLLELGAGFPPGYRDDFDARVAVLDIKNILQLQNGQVLAMSLYRLVEEDGDMLRLRLYHRGKSLPLSDVLPILENLGLRVVTERPYGIRTRSGEYYWLQEFSLVYSLAHDIDMEQVKHEFEDAFARIWFREAESDSFNRLLIGTRLSWREIALLRAYARYLRQVQFPFSAEYIAETMANHLHITAGIVELFLTRFSPVFDGDEDWRAQRELSVEQKILESLDQVQNLGEDRIIRQFIKLIKATLRTNFFQPGDDGELKPYFSFKLKPSAIPDIPQPVPMYEIFVYSPRLEGVHLRGGKVARGGLRWSDRLEDFRTEVLGLVKAQQVKNAVIVPVGAKGGFVAKNLTADMGRDEVREEGVACYKIFIRGLLDITDNRSDHGIVRPEHVVPKDDEDPYLVVAADKGTATFSDIANAISAEYNFWLGDAFASGGSAGYDHKGMGITARGAWVSVQRHFREMGIDIQSTDFTVVGVGDMGGDVFGNGMLLSPHICLLAAFNHQHIFIDPDPDAESSFVERERLFNTPHTSWADYNPGLISAGGGVFERSAKSITVSPEMQERFDIEEAQLTPNDLIVYLLKARFDLLWNGGIGTYVKASMESHTEVGDKANDCLRIDATDLRCRVIGEGGNLGVTQLARVEFAMGGGRSNTDFVDNAAGVDCSDHEVNIKILLDTVVARGDLTEKHRNRLLEEMTDSVAELVLDNNYHQTQAISLVEFQAMERSGEYRRFIRIMEDEGRIDRGLEFIPSDEELAERRAQGKTLTRPELSVIVSYTKGILKEQLIDADLGEDSHLAELVKSTFPSRLVDQYPQEIIDHGLYREIMATQLANDIVNRMGLNFMLRQRRATGASVGDVAKAYVAALELFRLREVWHQVEALDHKVDTAVQLEMMLQLIRLVKRVTRWILRNRRNQLTPSDLMEEFSEGMNELFEMSAEVFRGRAADQYQNLLDHYTEVGVEEALALRVARTTQSYTALGIIQVGTQTDVPLFEVAQFYFLLGERLELDWFTALILAANVDSEWQAMARDAYLEDIEWQHRSLTLGALRHRQEDGNILKALQSWEKQEAALLRRWQEMLVELHATETPDFSMFAVANRELLDLAQSSTLGVAS